MKELKRLFAILLIFIHFNARAQKAIDSSFAYAATIYDNTIGLNRHLYKGSQYIDYDHRIKGNPFFNATFFKPNEIVYDDIAYNNVELFYDVLRDNVVIKNYNGTPMVLVKEKVSSFNTSGHHFINLGSDSSLTNQTVAGFYDVLYDGNIKLLARRKKILIQKLTTIYVDSYFEEKDEHYIFKNNTLYAVNDKRSVLSVLSDQKEQLNKYVHQSKISFTKDAESAMIKMVSYYDELNTAK